MTNQGAPIATRTTEHPHHLPLSDFAALIGTDPVRGLTADEAAHRLAVDGPNELLERPGPSIWQLVLAQFNNFLVYLLLAAAAISLLLREFIDASAILSIVALNAVLGVVQEARANKAMAALKRMASPTARVVRGGSILELPSRDLVQGDVVLLEAGNYVPADLRLVEAVNLRIEEAALTGESQPVEKDAAVTLPPEAPLGDRINSAYMGTLLVYGRGRGIVSATGMRAEIGKIATMLQAVEEGPTPLQERLAQLGKLLGTGCLIVAGIILAIGVGRIVISGEGSVAEQLVDLLLTAISLAIAAVPEGLPAIVTVALAIGMQRMARRHALIRKLPAVETLGSASFICSDKTGTLTQNEMMAVRLYAGGRLYDVTGRGYQPIGEILQDGTGAASPESDHALAQLLRCGLLCNDSSLEPAPPDGEMEEGQRAWRMVGDPTEGALVVLAAKAGLWRDEQDRAYPRLAEVPFDSTRKRMITLHPDPQSGRSIAYLKGGPDVVLDLCDAILEDGEVVPLTDDMREAVSLHNEEMASDALRVLGFASRALDAIPERPDPAQIEQGCVFLGLVGMIDAARPEVKDAIQVCRTAGIRPVMITGDFLLTGVAIAKELALLRPGARAITGADLDKLDDEEFLAQVEDIDVYARVSPAHKVRIVDALMQRGHVVAMTGDGVNDAPALKRADIGVAMGITGTDVTKETAEMVLTNDNFASIVAAVEEGRIIYSNIRKFVYYLLSANLGEVLIVFVSMVVGLPLPLRPIHLLTLNLLTDGAPALALGVEKGDPDIMHRPPRPPSEDILNTEMRWLIAVQAVAFATASLIAFVIALNVYPAEDHRMAQTISFATVVCGEILRAYSARSERWSLWAIGIFSNRFMMLASFASILILLLSMYVPFLQPIFDTTPLPLEAWYIVAPLSFVSIVAAELGKAFLRWRSPSPQARRQGAPS